MHVRTLGYQSELLFHRFDAQIIDGSDHLVIRTPHNPSYYWGNLLLFRTAPGPSDVDRWMDLFRRAFADMAQIRHMTFAWDDPLGPEGALASFLDAGFEANAVTVLTAKALAEPDRHHPDLHVRELLADRDWDQALALMEACHDGNPDFLRQQMLRYRKMAQAGLGGWYGGYLDNTLAGCLGLFRGDGWGRFQQVHTHPDFRRQGVCATLVHRVAQEWLARPEIAQLIMMAEPASQAERIYQSVGFAPEERLGGLVKAPQL